MTRSPVDARTAGATTVKTVILRESRLRLEPDDLSDDEPLNGNTLRINSLAFVGMLVQIEDELDMIFPDDLFEGRIFATLADLIDVVAGVCGGPPEARG